ncbi:MAG: hypothetical protein AAF598_07385 [Bacteroidota bacterium]
MAALKAFTVLEMIIVLLLSGIVISSGWLVQNYVQEGLVSRSESEQEILKTLEYISSIKKHWNEAERIVLLSENRIQLLNNEFDVVYQLEAEKVVQFLQKPIERTHQLQVILGNHQFQMDQVEILPPHLIDQWSCFLAFKGKRIPIHLSKSYDAKTIFDHLTQN